MSHSDTLVSVINSLYESFGDDIRIFKRQVGRFNVVNEKTGLSRWIKVGEIGQSDLYGWFKGGKAFEIEVKVDDDPFKKEQQNWRDVCQYMGVGWFLYRDNMEELIKYMKEIK